MPSTLARLLAAAALVAAAGCAPGDGSPTAAPSPSPPPCGGSPASRVDLGHAPFDQAPTAAHFRTNGETLYLLAYNFIHGDLFDHPRKSTAVYIGPAGTPPSYDPRRSVVTPVTQQLSVTEREWAELRLPAGHYWLLTSNGPRVDIASCSPGGHRASWHLTGGDPAGHLPTGWIHRFTSV